MTKAAKANSQSKEPETNGKVNYLAVMLFDGTVLAAIVRQFEK